jgi:hypothetical protein
MGASSRAVLNFLAFIHEVLTFLLLLLFTFGAKKAFGSIQNSPSSRPEEEAPMLASML